KGKAPRAMIEKMYGEETFFEDAVNTLYPKAYADAAKESKLDIVGRPSIEIKSVDKNGFVMLALVAIKPEVEVSNYKGIEITHDNNLISDEDVESELAKLQEKTARLVDITHRAVQNNDHATINFEGFIDEKAFEGGKGENYPLVIGSNQFIPGFEEQIIGHSIDEEFDVNVSFPEDYHAAQFKGKSAVFKVKVLEIKNKELAVLDNEFAKDVSEFDTIDALKEDLKAKLQEAKEEQAKSDMENKLIDVIVDNMKADIPQPMVEARIDAMVGDFENRLQSQGVALELYLKNTGMSMEMLRKSIEMQANRQVKVRLALEKIVEVEKLTASDTEIKEEIAKIAQRYGMPVEQAEALIPKDEIALDIGCNKAIDFVRENAKIIFSSAKPEVKTKKNTSTATKTIEEPKKRTRKAATKTTDEK
ncbi:MAG: trigger factor, partial [Oscillospiraceae bacterium]